MLTKQEIIKQGYSVQFTNGTGKGGQKRNRTYSCAIVRHEESGTEKRCDDTRSANKNMNLAYEWIEAELKNQKENDLEARLNEYRKEAIAKGTIRTYDFKRGVVKNHLTNKEAPLKKVLNGNIELINQPISDSE